MYKYLLFDCDNTLLDFDQGERNAFETLCAAFSINPLTYPVYHTHNLACWKEFEQGKLQQQELSVERFRRFLPHTGASVTPQQASDFFIRELSLQGIPYPQTKPLLTELRKRGYLLYLASNGIATVQHGRYAACGITSFFDGVFISEELGFQKPDKRFFEAIFSQTCITDPEHAVMIGDSLSSDIKGGKAAGIGTIWFDRNETAGKPDVVPDHTITTLTDLLALLPPRSPSQPPKADSAR